MKESRLTAVWWWLVNLRPDANTAGMTRLRFRLRRFETFLCQLQDKESPGWLMNLVEKDGSECGALSIKVPAKRAGLNICTG